jgi:hypothetical protein
MVNDGRGLYKLSCHTTLLYNSNIIGAAYCTHRYPLSQACPCAHCKDDVPRLIASGSVKGQCRVAAVRPIMRMSVPISFAIHTASSRVFAAACSRTLASYRWSFQLESHPFHFARSES